MASLPDLFLMSTYLVLSTVRQRSEGQQRNTTWQRSARARSLILCLSAFWLFVRSMPHLLGIHTVQFGLMYTLHLPLRFFYPRHACCDCDQEYIDNISDQIPVKHLTNVYFSCGGFSVTSYIAVEKPRANISCFSSI